MSDNDRKGILDKIEDMKKDYKERSKVVEVKFNPLEKVPETKDQLEEKPKETGLRGLLKSQEQPPTQETPEKLKEDIKKEYLVVLESQMKAGNYLLAESFATIEREFREIVKEDESYEIDNSLLHEEKQEKALARRERKGLLEMTKNQMMKWVQTDMVKHFTDRYSQVKSIETNSIEIVKKVKLTELEIVFTTDEGEYVFDGRRASAFGGYLSLQVQMLTEILALDELAKALSSSNKAIREKAEAKTWLLINPLLVQAPNGKTLMMPMEYLRRSLLRYLDTSEKRKAQRTNFLSKAKVDGGDASIAKKVLFKTPREVVEGLLELKVPPSTSLITFPYNLLEESGIEFEMDIDFQNNNSLIGNIVEEKENFISWDTVNENREISKIEKYSSKVTRMVLDINKIKENSIPYGRILNAYTRLVDVKDLRNTFGDSQVDSLFRTFNADNLLAYLTSEVYPYLEEGRNLSEELEEAELKEVKEAVKTYKKYIETFEKYTEEISKLNFRYVDKLIDDVPKVMYYERDLTTRLEILKRTLQDIELPLDEEGFQLMYTLYTNPSIDQISLYMKLIDPETKEEGKRDLEFYITESMSDLHRIDKEKRNKIEELTSLINEYKEARSVLGKIHSAIGINKKAELENLEVKTTISGHPVDMTAQVLDWLFKGVAGLEEATNQSTKFSLPIPTVTEQDYLKVRGIVQHLGVREYINWVDILKILLGDSFLLSSRVRLHDDVRELVSVPELEGDLRRVNNLSKFFDPSVIPMTEDEDKFNQMFNEITKDYRGLICSINYTKLMSYIVEEEDNFKGEQIIKYIPNVKVVNKYFPIPRGSVIYPKLQRSRLVSEIPNLPAVYIALNHIMYSTSPELNANRDMFDGSVDHILKYSELREELSSKNLGRHYKRDIDDLAVKHDAALNQFYYLLGDLKGTGPTYHATPFHEVKDDIRQLYTSPVAYNISLEKADKAREEYQRLEEEMVDCKKKMNELKEKAIQVAQDEINEASANIESLREEIQGMIGTGIDKVMSGIYTFYNYESSKKELMRSWSYLKFDKFSKGRVLLNFILTYVKDEVEMVQSAIFQLIREFLMELNTTSRIRKGSEVDKIIHTFELMTFTLKLDRVLPMKSEDRIEITKSLETGTESNISEQDQALLQQFEQTLIGMNDYNIAEAFKKFKRKDLINDELYLTVAYYNEGLLERQYPSWYVRDFNLAENIKIMLECGVPIEEILEEHRQDEKLMKMVEESEIDADYIEIIKQQL